MADIEEKDVDLEDKKEDAAEEETKDEDKDEETKDEDKAVSGCNGVAGPPCCPNLAQGEMEGGREEALAGVAFADCPAACKKKGAVGVSTDNLAQSCYCEFAGQTWNRVDAHYKTCVIKKTPAILYKSLGCWRDKWNRAIPTLEKKDNRLTGKYERRQNAIKICYEVAKSKGYKAFALQNGGWCASSSTALSTYDKYGKKSNCRNGKGGRWANDVYQIVQQCQYQDKSSRCAGWKSDGHCTGGWESWMKANCGKTCLCQEEKKAPACKYQNESNKCDKYTCTGSRNRVRWMKKNCAKKCSCDQGPAPTCTCNEQSRAGYGKCQGRKQSGRVVCYVNVDEYGRSGCSDQMKSRNGKWYYSYNACEGRGQGK